MQRKLTTINEDVHPGADDLESESKQIAQELYALKSYAFSVNNMLECNFNPSFMNTNFDEQELIEEYLDRFVHQYAKIKEHFKKGREIRYHKEQKAQEKMNELRYARNVLAHHGIKPFTE